MQKNIYRSLLALMTVLGCALRFTGLSRESLRLDEAMSFDVIARPLGEIALRLHTDPHPPVYFWVLRCWTAVFGTSEAGMRSLSAALGTATIPLAAAFAMRLLSPAAALCAAFLLAVSPFHLYYSQDARPYALFGLLLIVSWCLFVDFFRKGGKLRLMFYCGTLIAMLYTHIFGFFTAAAHLAASPSFLKGKRQLLKQWIAGQFAVLAGSLYWYRLYLDKRDSVPAQIEWLPLPRLSDVTGLFRGFAPSEGPLEALSLFLIGAGILAFSEAAYIPLRRFVLYNATIPLFGAIAVSYLVHPIFWPRYFFATFLCSQFYAGVSLASALSSQLLRPVVSVAIVWLSWSGVDAFFHITVNPQWREAAALFERRASRDAPIFPFPAYNKAPLRYYLSDYSRAHPLDKDRPLPAILSAEPPEIWVIGRSGSARIPGTILPSNYQLKEHFSFYQVALLRFERGDAKTGAPLPFDSGSPSH